MSTRSRSSFRRSLQSTLFRSASPTPSQASQPTIPPNPSAEKTRHIRRDKVKEAIEQFFGKLHHQHRSELTSRTTHTHGSDARSSDSHSIAKSISPASSRNASIKHVNTDVSLVPYDLTDRPHELIAETSNRPLFEEDEVIDIRDGRIPTPEPLQVAHAESTECLEEQEPPVLDGHIRLPTETSVEIVIPRDPEEDSTSHTELPIAHSVDASVPPRCELEQTTPALSTDIVSSPQVISEPPATSATPTSVVSSSKPSTWFIDLAAIVPYYRELRQLILRGCTREAARPEKSSAGLFGFLFNNCFTRMAAFAFDLWLLSICFFLVKVLRVRPRVLKQVESWFS